MQTVRFLTTLPGCRKGQLCWCHNRPITYTAGSQKAPQLTLLTVMPQAVAALHQPHQHLHQPLLLLHHLSPHRAAHRRGAHLVNDWTLLGKSSGTPPQGFNCALRTAGAGEPGQARAKLSNQPKPRHTPRTWTAQIQSMFSWTGPQGFPLKCSVSTWALAGSVAP